MRERRPFASRRLEGTAPHLVQVARQSRRVLAQVLAGGVQRHPLWRAHDQWSSDPSLECLDAAAEGRLGNVPRFCRPGEVPALRQRQEVLEPVQLHARCRLCIANVILGIGGR